MSRRSGLANCTLVLTKKNHHFKWCDGMLASLLNILVTLLLYQTVARGGPGIGFVWWWGGSVGDAPLKFWEKKLFILGLEAICFNSK